jgi:FkbM family methyltransferase
LLLSDEQVKNLTEEFIKFLQNYSDPQFGLIISPVEKLFLYRLLLGRSPDANLEIPTLLETDVTYREMLNSIINSIEFGCRSGFIPPDHHWMCNVDGLKLWFNTGDREMGVTMAIGTYEPKVTNALKLLIQPGMRCIDAGAHIGFFTCQLAKKVGKFGKVFAFEPHPENFKLLKKNVYENKLQSRIELSNSACSDNEGTFLASKYNHMCIVGDVEEADKVKVNLVVLDNVISEKIDFVKMDIEGHEPKALNGMKRILSKDRPIILIEINNQWLKMCSSVSGRDLLALLNSFDYNCFTLDDSSQPINPETFSTDIQFNTEILAMPSNHTSI